MLHRFSHLNPRPTSSPAGRGAAALALMLCLPLAQALFAQPAEPPPGDEAPQQTVSFGDLPPGVQLGVRVENARRLLPVARTLVVVPDAGAFLDAVGRWTMQSRFPILIDDGTADARENIARFVRAFGPTRVLRWAGDGTHDLSAPISRDERQTLLAGAAAQAWGAADPAALNERWRELGFVPPGVVIASVADRAWPAAVALSAGRGEPLVWLPEKIKGGVGATVTETWFGRFLPTLHAGLDAQPWPWREFGDAIDAATICMSFPVRVHSPSADPPGPIALTDLLPRHADGARWGWAGLIPGDEAESLWRAMCALFLQPTTAWLVDAYRDRAQFSQYQIAPAADLLTRVGLTVRALEDVTLSDWRAEARAGVSAGFIHINSSDGVYGFNLFDGRAPASDVPIDWSPAIVHMIHSFSAARLDDRRSVARRWLDGGAYIYIGSIHEPYLTAFHTPERLVARWLTPSPLGVAAMRDMGRPWRIVYIGDPLVTFGPPAPAAPTPDLPGAEDAEKSTRDALRDGDLEAGLRGLVTLGRDADAARLVRAMLDDRPDAVTPTVARLGWRPLIRTGQSAALVALLDHLGPGDRDNPSMIDLLWLALRPSALSGDAGAIAALSTRLRDETFGEDAADLAGGLRRSRGVDAARRFLSALRQRAPDDRARQLIDDALAR